MSAEIETQTTLDRSGAPLPSWQNLDKRRLAIGLLAAPILPVLLGYGLIFLMPDSDPSDPWDMTLTAIAVTGCASIWSLALGLLYFGLVMRPFKVGRWHCFFLAMIASATFCAALEAAITAVSFLFDLGLREGWRNAVDLFFIAPFTIPFGLLGGLVFWSIGIRQCRVTSART
jgi:hypothetical protein